MSRASSAMQRIRAIFIKELVQMRRDRMTFAMMFLVPIMQLVLFGYAVNTNPKHLPTAILTEEHSPMVRSLIQGLSNSEYYTFVLQTDDPRQSADLLARGDVAFVISIPSGFTRRLVRNEHPQILIEADASDPAAASAAISHAQTIIARALRHDFTGSLAGLASRPPAFDLVVHPKFNPEGVTGYNIVPGLLGVILTMTMVMITSIAMTRESERGTMENLLAMPARPSEVMLGKISPYAMVGATQTTIILIAARLLFDVPFVGPLWLLLTGVLIFVIANLALGFTFSTIARSQMQAMQLTFFFFLPSLLLSGFMFPFRGMPRWAQMIGELFPLTHFLRVVRGVMLKDAHFAQVRAELLAMLGFTALITTIAMARYRRTLD
jgi:ABC-2 type transport system permease protein